MNSLISVDELQSILPNHNLIILDASQTNAKKIQIIGARVFDIKNKFSIDGQFPNTFPTAEQFENGCQKLGIDKNSKVVVYDNKGIFSSPRVWWMFKTFGHKDVAVLDGGLPAWIQQGFETESFPIKEYTIGNFEANLQFNQVKYIEDIQQNIISEECVVIDARSEERFNGAPESREGLRSGHIPKSKNLPYTELLENGKFKSIEDIRVYFIKIESGEKPIIFTCGSGITACILLLAYQMTFEKEATIYDGSWTEWGTLASK